MIDRLGNELKVGDKVVAYSSMRTGSSHIRMVQYEGEIVGFTPRLAMVKCIDCPYPYTGREFRVSCDNIFKMGGDE